MIYHVEIAGKGGITQYTFNLVTHLQNAKSSEKLGIIGAKNYELENLPRNFRLFHVFNRFKTNPFVLLYFFLFKIKCRDIVHFQLSSFPEFVLLLILILKLKGCKKIVVTVHNVVSHETNFWTKHILLNIYRLASRLIVHAQQNKDELTEGFRIAPEKVWVIPHGNYMFANPDETEPAAPVEKERFELLFFGYIREYKGLDYLLKSIDLVRRKNPKILLNIVGKPFEDFEKYRSLIKELQIEEFVHLHLDYVPFEKMKYYFNRVDVVVLPYKRISQSGVIFLSYAFARPVIATNIGGIPEVVEDGRSGILVPPHDVNALAEAILRLMEHPEQVKEMGAYARQLSKTKYSWQAIAEKTWELYRSLQAS